MNPRHFAIVALLAGIMTPLSFVSAMPGPTHQAEERAEAAEEAREAAEAFKTLMTMPGRAIPIDLLSRAEAIAVFDNVYQAAFLVGGRGGDGLISRRSATGWTPPAFFKLGGASFGAQIGGTRTDLVLLFMNSAAIEALLDDRLELGAEVIAVAGPAQAGASTASASLKQGILVYSRHEGLFAGAALKGAVVTPHNELNRMVYSQTARQLLTGTATKTPAGMASFVDTLSTYTMGKGNE